MPDKPKLKIAETQSIPFSMLDITDNKVKIHSDKQIKGLAEMMKLGKFNQPFLITKNLNKRKKHDVIAGKGRYLAISRHFQIPETVPCVYLEDLTEEQLKAYMLLDNRISEIDWDVNATTDLLSQIPTFEFDGFHVDFNEFFAQSNRDLSEQEWKNMPEFIQAQKNCFQAIIVRFDRMRDVKSFSDAIGQKVNKQTKSIWYPQKQKSDTIQKYVPKKK